jgi:transposase InsO family protein
MRLQYRHVGLSRFCKLLGITRQAFYQHFWRSEDKSVEHQLVLQQVLKIRKRHRHMGTRKLYEKLQPFLLEHQIKIGRDALFDLLSANCMLVRKRKRKVQTTQSYHWLRKYPNLIKDFMPRAPNQLWVSDITYWKVNGSYLYISFITDSYSHKIVGFHVAETLESVETIQALKMALSGLIKEPDSHFELVHHSDRGVQYCHHEYVKLLNDYNIKISMTENGDPLENPIAERVNGIIKEEYLQDYCIKTIQEAKKVLDYVVRLYNEDRPHNSIGNLLPNQVHDEIIKTERLWKNYYRKNPTTVNQL